MNDEPHRRFRHRICAQIFADQRGQPEIGPDFAVTVVLLENKLKNGKVYIIDHCQYGRRLLMNDENADSERSETDASLSEASQDEVNEAIERVDPKQDD
ncbi:hypothetical protein [Halosolutus gelatinilyticus]|uniref:hypothetical protein n=1 Tax=Halosolutus gelatinilyticus TaxID=2931975 RepID=UPI001FF1C70D|nr:hypothetical protein [Halosolutus gelatinilyticus]